MRPVPALGVLAVAEQRPGTGVDPLPPVRLADAGRLGQPAERVGGEMVFELEGEPARVVRAGEAFWEPGGDVIHYQNGNNRDDIPVRYTVTMLGAPGKPMLTLVDEDELARRKDRRGPAPAGLGPV